MNNLKFRHFDTRLQEMRYSDIHSGEFYINTKGVLYMYAIPKGESGSKTKYYRSYDVEAYTETITPIKPINKSENKMKAVTNANEATMSHVEIAKLVGSRNDKVKQSMERLQEKGVISFTPMGGLCEKSKQSMTYYNVNERDSYIVAAQLSPEFTAFLVDEWQKKKAPVAPVFQIPQTLGDALQLAADQAKQLELQAPKVAFVDNCVERGVLMTATQVAQKHNWSAVKLNRYLDNRGDVYSKSVKRTRVFTQQFIDEGYGELKQTRLGYDQPLFTTAGEQWINKVLISDGEI